MVQFNDGASGGQNKNSAPDAALIDSLKKVDARREARNKKRQERRNEPGNTEVVSDDSEDEITPHMQHYLNNTGGNDSDGEEEHNLRKKECTSEFRQHQSFCRQDCFKEQVHFS